MEGFLELNKHKLRFAFFASSITFLTLVIIALTVSYFNERFPGTVLLITILFGAGIGFPLFIMVLAYFEWLSKQKVRKRAFSVPPFNQLDKIGFSKSLMNEKTKWLFTEESKEALINNFTIKCIVTKADSEKIQFKALARPSHMDKHEFKRLERHLKKQGIRFDFEGLIKMYDLKNSRITSVHQLEADLIGFTELLKKEGFETLK